MAARALDDAGFLNGAGAEPEKGDGLSPETLLADPATWYATLDRALAEAAFGPADAPSAVSPASRLVERCRGLEP